MVLPLEEVQGRSCVAVSNNSPWLMHLLAGTRSGTAYRGAVHNFVKDCAQAFAECTANGPEGEQSADAHLAPLADAASSQVGAPKRGRGKILDSDDEAEVAKTGVVVKAAAKPRRKVRTRRGEFVNLNIRGFALTFTVSSGPKIMIPLQGNGIQNIVDNLLPRRGEAKGLVSAAAAEITKHMTEEDKGRVLWRRPSACRAGSWTVYYEDSAGKRCSSSAGLRVPRQSLAGDMLSADEITGAALQVLLKARRLWNRLDRSEAERYVF